MFDTVNGLPLHPLVVHAIVVLLPIAAVGTIVIALAPRWRRRYGWIVVAAAAVSTALIPVDTQSGEALEQRVGNPGEHAEVGGQLIWFAIPLLIMSAALMVLDWRQAATSSRVAASPSAPLATLAANGSDNFHGSSRSTTRTTRWQGTLVKVVAGLAVVAALAT